MLRKEQILQRLRENYHYLSTQYGVKRVGIFGSYAKGTPQEASDIDILVEFDRPIGLGFMELGDYLEQLLGAKVDMLTLAGLQGIRVERVARDIAESVEYV